MLNRCLLLKIILNQAPDCTLLFLGQVRPFTLEVRAMCLAYDRGSKKSLWNLFENSSKKPNWTHFQGQRPHRCFLRNMVFKLQILSLADNWLLCFVQQGTMSKLSWVAIFATSATGHDKVCPVSNGAILLLMGGSHKASCGTQKGLDQTPEWI